FGKEQGEALYAPNETSTGGQAEPRQKSAWLRSLGALLAGFVVVVILSVATDAVLRAVRVFPSAGQVMSNALFLLATVYRTAYGIAGSYVTARLAPNRPLQHALAGGFVGLVLSIAGAVATWKQSATMGPHWYPLALVLTALPAAWVGGRLRQAQINGSRA